MAIIRPEDPVRVLMSMPVAHVPVVSDGRVLGIVSARDALRVLADDWRRTREVVE
jgi:CBS domain-containing protein